MRYTMQKSWYVVIAALALMLLVTGPLAAQVTFTLNGVGSGENFAGVYTSPYSGYIGSNGPTIPVICDDFSDESYVPETWSAYVTQLSSVTSGTPGAGANLKWTGATVGSVTLNQAQAYTVAAVLAVEILQNTAPADAVAEEELSYAMWALFDPTGSLTDPGALIWLGDEGYPIGSTFYSAVTTDLGNAVQVASTDSAQVQADVKATTIYSYDSGATGGCGGPCTAPQEFITVNMVEPPSPALLGFDLLAVTGLILFIRRRSKLTQA